MHRRAASPPETKSPPWPRILAFALLERTDRVPHAVLAGICPAVEHKELCPLFDLVAAQLDVLSQNKGVRDGSLGEEADRFDDGGESEGRWTVAQLPAGELADELGLHLGVVGHAAEEGAKGDVEGHCNTVTFD